MSPERAGIQALKSAIMAEATEEVSTILAEAQARAESISQQAQTQAGAEGEAILQRARGEAKALREHTIATAQLEAQTLRLKRREQLLERAFADARQQLSAVPQSPDYAQIASRLLREAVERLGVDEVVVRADEETRRVFGDRALADIGGELGVRLRAGEPLARSTGVVLETPDGHLRYDNTLETRLARMRDVLRTPVYHILMGETP
jgi:V/A-type H+-transporting ATPase subunit E